MDSTSHAPWQVGPVSPAGRIAAAALMALAADSVFLWPAAPHLFQSLAITGIPLVVAIRVLRGFSRSVELATTTFGLVAVLGVAGLANGRSYGPQVTAALTVAALLAAAGLLPTALDRFKLRRLPIVEAARPAPVLARRGTSRRYR